MLREARQNLLPSGRVFKFDVIDAQDIPFATGSFDAVIANHMLYHVPDRERALSEIHRVLKPRGRFYATTNGRAHMRELRELIRWFQAEELGNQGNEWERGVGSFSLETGMAQLSPWFAEIRVERYEDALLITDIEPLVAYVMSSISAKIERGRVEEFKRFLQREVAAEGAIRIGKDSGMFKAVRGDVTHPLGAEGSRAEYRSKSGQTGRFRAAPEHTVTGRDVEFMGYHKDRR
jgi:SAM-dependent methyltransferase